MSNPLPPGAIHDAVVALLAAELPSSIPVGDSGAPDAGPGDVLDASSGHVVVDLLPDGSGVTYPGWTGSDTAMRWVRQQVVGYGVQPNQARWISQRCKLILLGHDDADGFDNTPAASGLTVIDRRLVNDIPADGTFGLHSAGFLIEWLASLS